MRFGGSCCGKSACFCKESYRFVAGLRGTRARDYGGKLDDGRHIRQRCENLWIGLNDWLRSLGIDYTADELPF